MTGRLGAVVAGATAVAVAAVLATVLTTGSTTGAPTRGAAPSPTPSPTPGPTPERRAAPPSPLPLAGVRIALDPGHQLGNRNFPEQVTRSVPAGGFAKPCNTTGTSTAAGYPEASLNFAIAASVRKRLRALGATVFLTRDENSDSRWGPCVNVRGGFGAKVGADLALSLHADGSGSGSRGFHVITPIPRAPWTDDIAGDSRRLALAVRAGLDASGLPRANYVGGGTGLVVRGDLATLNLSDVPIVLVEVGNMRNRSDAARMSTYAGRTAYAVALVDGIRRYLDR